ncbi:MAG: sodium:solute symporter [Bacteroidia bacterium]|nr:sodium:solute symporter [Bacteroidia bacterium]
MSPVTVFSILLAYFALLLLIGYITSRKADSASFFIGNRKSPWYIVAIGMVGSTISGVTFISVPGWVGSSHFAYMQMVLGYLAGYFVIANILLPTYYRLNLTSIYTYLERRMGFSSYKTGAAFFLISRIVGSACRLYLVANVLQIMIFDAWHVPFIATVIITILLIWLYTFRGGVKTIIWTDIVQALIFLAAVAISVIIIGKEMNLNPGDIINKIAESNYSQMFFFDDLADKRHFIWQFLSGAFICIVMTGLDQDMMQKNLSCRNIRDAKKNMFTFSMILVPVNLLFLCLGALLFLYTKHTAIAQDDMNLITVQSDNLYPIIATRYLSPIAGILFVLGIVAAAYSSADSALTALTTSFTVDILNTKNLEEKKLQKIRIKTHIMISVIMVIIILIFRVVNDRNVISAIFTYAGFTYGPLLGMYAYGLFTKLQPHDKFVPVVAILSPFICIGLKAIVKYFTVYEIGFELLIYNGLITFIGLLIVTRWKRLNK